VEFEERPRDSRGAMGESRQILALRAGKRLPRPPAASDTGRAEQALAMPDRETQELRSWLALVQYEEPDDRTGAPSN